MALKGKGEELIRWHAEVNARLSQVHREMVDLAIASRDARGWRWALIAQRSIRGATQLRWRGADWRHAVWEQVLTHLVEVPPAVAQWYHETQTQVEVLNHQEQAIRYELRAVMRLAEKLSATHQLPSSDQLQRAPQLLRPSLAKVGHGVTNTLEGNNPA